MILFVRHGETPLNFHNMMCGGADVPLTAKGLTQADNTGKMLKGERIDAVFCSTMLRARQTADKIIKYHEGIPIFYDDRLRERKAGDLEGLQAQFYPIINQRWDENFDCDRYHYETTDSLFSRAESFLRSIENLKGKNVLIVAHSGINRVFKAILNGDGKNADLKKFGMQNGEIMRLPF